MKLLNAFSLQMVPDGLVSISTIDLDLVKKLLADREIESAIGHPDTARLLTDMLRREVECARKSITLEAGETAIVAQVVGGRLPEGCTTLPEGVKIVFKLITFEGDI